MPWVHVWRGGDEGSSTGSMVKRRRQQDFALLYRCDVHIRNGKHRAHPSSLTQCLWSSLPGHAAPLGWVRLGGFALPVFPAEVADSDPYSQAVATYCDASPQFHFTSLDFHSMI